MKKKAISTRILWSRTFVGSWLRGRFAARWRRIDHIPDRALLWRAIKPDSVYKKDGSIKPSFFRDRRGHYSCDIAAFSTPEQSRRGYADPPAWNPDEAGLVEFTAGDVRHCSSNGGPDVEHAPVQTQRVVNYSHAQFSRELSSAEEEMMAKERARIVIKPRM
ncbi:MAG: hypothetical protein M3Q69_02275 [Acidobacteriota bacterium]|nr:hypothetical protein [Acidobacteriota bacterium]